MALCDFVTHIYKLGVIEGHSLNFIDIDATFFKLINL
jgi:hypothetical protein